MKDDLPFQATSAQFDSGMWQCTVSATTYQGRIFFRDTLDSDPVSLVVLRTPSHAEIRRRDDVSGTIAGLAGKDLEAFCFCSIVFGQICKEGHSVVNSPFLELLVQGVF